MRRRHIYRFSVVLAAGLAAAGLAACSSSNSSTAASGTATSLGPGGSTITVDARLSADSPPLWIAEQDGFFKQEGLTVNVSFPASTSAEFAGLAAHTVDFAQAAYVNVFAEEKTNPKIAMRIIAPDDQTAPNTNVIMVPQKSSVKSVPDLKGKVIAFSSPGVSLASLALDEQLKGYGLSPKSYTEDTLGYPAMTEPLERGQIGAAFSIQPYITQMESQIGAHELIDLMTGPMLNFPQLGWVTTSAYAQQHPATVAAFQRAIAKAQQVAASDPALVRQLLAQKVSGVTTQLANILPLPTYPATVNLAGMQRVVTVMEQFGVLPANFNVQSMLISAPSGS
jgi:NitT/TauT family transport system substrate-binding protein